MSLIKDNNNNDILIKESPWGAPRKSNKQPDPQTSAEGDDLAQKFQDGLKNIFGGNGKQEMIVLLLAFIVLLLDLISND
jgi:hypothetical protein